MRVVASDIVAMSHCPRRLWYERSPPKGIDLALDAFDQLVVDMGLAHEVAVRDRLSQDIDVIEATSAAHTRDLMEAGVSAIYQAELHDAENDLLGKPDFLLRKADGTYQAADAKLARSMKPEIGVQVAFYKRLLGTNHAGLVYLGDGSVDEVGTEFDARLNRFITEARMIVSDDERPQVFFGATKCGTCPFNSICVPEFEAGDDLSLLYGVDPRSIPRLVAAGINTITELAQSDPDAIPDVPYLKGEKKHRAVAQAQAIKTGRMIKHGDVSFPKGTFVHFDIEVNPLTYDGNVHVYLWGFLVPPYGSDDFEYVWTDGQDDDRAGWMGFLEMVGSYRADWPDLKLVHFSSYERTMIRAYARRYEMENHLTVAWLLNESGPLYDIQNAVTDNLVLPLRGYGLKAIAKHPDLVNFQWKDEASGSQWSVVQYVNFLSEADPTQRDALKAAILGYNRDDVIATYKLEQWLRSL